MTAVREGEAPAGALAPAPAAASGFTVRRLPKPNYRRPTQPGRTTPLGLPAPIAVDNLHSRLVHRRDGPMPLTEWNLGMQEDQGQRGTYEIEVAGRSRPGVAELLGGRASAFRQGWSFAAGDLPASTLRSTGPLMRLRGAGVGRAHDDGHGWTALAAVAAPGTGLQPEGTTLSLFSMDGLRLHGGRAAFTLAGFARGRGARPPGNPPLSLAEFPGRGGGGMIEVRTAPGRDLLALSLGTQLHDLGGHDAPAALQRLEWRIVRTTAALTLLEQRASNGARSLGDACLPRAARRDDRLTAQWRPLGGRAETHFTAVASTGEGTLPASRSASLGGSSSLGRSAWYAGAESEWRGGAPASPPSSRLAVRMGRFGDRGSSVLLQLERQQEGHASPALILTGQASSPSRGGWHASLEPRLGWRDGVLQNFDLGLDVSWGRVGSFTRLTASLTLGGTRAAAFACQARKAALRLAFAPRMRDRGVIEVRRIAGPAAPAWEYETDYDLQGRRYLPVPGLTPGSRWTGTVRVLVARAEDGSGVPEALVSLDGRQLAFTAADGTLEFDRVEPGIHVVRIEERSLPRGMRVVQTTQVFVVVERGKPAEPVRIEVARAARKTEF